MDPERQPILLCAMVGTHTHGLTRLTRLTRLTHVEGIGYRLFTGEM